MARSLMFTLVLLVGLAAVLAGCGAPAEAGPPSARLEIDVVVEPAQPAVGESTLVVTVRDAAGNPVDGARVSAHGTMDHDGMAPVDAEATFAEGGVYRIPFTWTMGGGWTVTLRVSPPRGELTTAEFDVQVGAVASGSIINRNRNGTTPDVTPETGSKANGHGHGG